MYMLAEDMEMAGQERNKMNKVFRENGIRPVLSLFPALFQGVFFVSYFMAIRGMAYAPVTSMMAGGALWFPDLTMPDPSFILPIMSCAGFLISLEVGVCVDNVLCWVLDQLRGRCVCVRACMRACAYVCVCGCAHADVHIRTYVRILGFLSGGGGEGHLPPLLITD